MSFLKLIRYKNLLMVAVVQLLIKYALFPAFAIDTTLSSLGFAFLILSTVCIAAGGYIINDIYDVETDTINKPNKVIIGKKIKENIAYNLYFAFTITGVLLGFYLSQTIGKPAFFSLFVVIAALLYIYAIYLKQIAVAGNIIISLLVGFSIIIVGVFELIPAITLSNQSIQSTMFEVLTDYAVFAFLINFIREIVKDIIDVDGDHKQGMQTLPILLGKLRTGKTAFGVTIFTIFVISYYISAYLFMHSDAIAYFLIAVIGPLIYTAIKLFMAKTKSQFKHVSLMLKVIMVTGMFSMLLYRFIF
ncbi:prenyltransferase [Bizionia saleffrena]|uniref:Prenyltransferase n=1 Tax=Bizionia saleffrena TaxID=291189 RepID=A0A8H2LCK8_9FLAO|nr:geranylgeranylglycerol-phosphate geranylgeranyltransferase [Bizionia saleffrena]TYB71495.1 prenyltransferase [Bizionia saleffrena]